MAEIRNGMRIGLGTGSTARAFVELLGAAVAEGLECVCVPTSTVTAAQAESLGIPLASLEEVQELDVTVDGADELDGKLRLIKGAGGALLREKIVAVASERMVVIADPSKKVETLGAFKLPIEIDPFGAGVTVRHIRGVADELGLEGALEMRKNEAGSAYVTDGGNWLVDASFGRISNPEALEIGLLRVPGVVETGLFLGICAAAYIAGPDGIEHIAASAKPAPG